MRYYFLIESLPTSKNFGKPWRVGRLSEDYRISELWKNGAWIDFPRMVEATGIGGVTDWLPTTEQKALEFVRMHPKDA